MRKASMRRLLENAKTMSHQDSEGRTHKPCADCDKKEWRKFYTCVCPNHK